MTMLGAPVLPSTHDNDGDLDLIVCNYVDMVKNPSTKVWTTSSPVSGKAYGPPTDFAGTQSYLYRNDGSHFTDVSVEAGIHVTSQAGVAEGKALAVMPLDLNQDGWMDLIIANDTVRNFAFITDRGHQFVESGIDLGLAFDTSGQATGAMGIDAARYQDNKIAVAIGNFANEMTSFYVGHDGTFSDDAIISGIGANHEGH